MKRVVGNAGAQRARAASDASQHHASSQPGMAAKLRARFGPPVAEADDADAGHVICLHFRG